MTLFIRAAPLLSLISFASATDILVAPHGGGDATSIQGGIDLAVDGDLILVLPGDYVESPLIDDLSVWIIAQQPGTVRVAGVLSVVNLTRNDHCVLSGLSFMGVPNPALSRQNPVLFVQDCLGLLHLHQCLFEGARASTQNLGVGGPGALLIDASRVIATRTDFIAGDGAEQSSVCTGSEGGPGVRAIRSRFTAWGGRVEGGAGTSCGRSLPFTSGDGGVGLFATTSSSVFLSSVSVEGGNGGDDLDFIPSTGGDGGDALEGDSDSFLVLEGSTLLGGQAGGSLLGTPGSAGMGISGNGILRVLAGPPQLHDLVALLPAGIATTLVVRGEAGKTAVVFGQAGPPPFLFDHIARPGRRPSPVLFPVSFSPLPLGVIPITGELTTPLTFPSLPLGSTSMQLTFRVQVGNVMMQRLLGSPMPVVAVDCATFGQDCDADGDADLCEILAGTALDVDQNGIPDGCQPDCNGNGTPDFLDVSAGTSLDFNGNGVPDECEVPGTVHVDPAAAQGGDGSPASPFRTLQEAVNATISGGEIVLSDGVYSTPADRQIELETRAVTIRSSGGPGVCTIDIQGDGRAFRSFQAAAPGLLLSGIRFTNGDVTSFTGVTGVDEGGALFVRDGQLSLDNCVFESNAAKSGGAISLRNCNSRIANSRFESNSQSGSTGGGGAVCQLAGDVQFESCSFESNTAEFAGGALRLRPDTGDSTAVSRCLFFGNESSLRAGAVAISPLNSLGPDIIFISQCVMAHNRAPIGGAVSGSGQSRTFIGLCTFTENEGILQAGAVSAQLGMDLILVNNVIWGNTAPVGAQASVLGINSSITISSSDLEGGIADIEILSGGSIVSGAGLLNSDPLFVNPSGPDGDPLTFLDNDYRLSAGSPSIDAGDVFFVTPDVTDMDGDGNLAEEAPFDLDGAPRRLDDPLAPNTGIGPLPNVDLGPFER